MEGVFDRNAATRLRGATLYARQEERPQDLSEDEYLVPDLVGIEVYLLNSVEEEEEEEDSEEKDGDDEDSTFIGCVAGIVFADEMCSVQGLGSDYLEVALGVSSLSHVAAGNAELVLIVSVTLVGISLLALITNVQHICISFPITFHIFSKPFVPEIVPTVNINSKEIYIDPPTGLLDLTYVRQEQVRIKGFLPPAKS